MTLAELDALFEGEPGHLTHYMLNRVLLVERREHVVLRLERWQRKCESEHLRAGLSQELCIGAVRYYTLALLHDIYEQED